MRIIAGEHRRRSILSPPDASVTRPITDRVKEALFSRLWSMGALEDSAVAVDLFAGTGSLGLEALSRGVAQCVFVEKHRQIRGLLEKNLRTLGLTERSRVVAGDTLSLNWSAVLPAPADLVFCDPPYAMAEDAASLDRVKRMLADLAPACSPAATLMLRTPAKVDPGAIAGWAPPDSHRYGGMTLHFYFRDVQENS